MEKPKRKKFISLSQGEVLGFDDEIISVNVTRLKRYFFCLIGNDERQKVVGGVSFGYMLNGFFVGWSSKFFSFDEEVIGSHHFHRSQISWIISAFPLGVVLVSIFIYKCYYWIGTKNSLLGASTLILSSWALTIVFGSKLEMLICARMLGGFGSGIIFILVPIYMKELMGATYNGNIVDLLITQFGLGIFSQYFIDLTTPMQLSVISVLLSLFFFGICCLIPESPRYQAFHDLKVNHTYDSEATVKLHNLWSEQDLQRKSILDLFDELKKLNLLSLIGLILVEQFIGGISILFYMKHFAKLTGGQFSPELIATTVGVTLILSIPLSKLIRFSQISSTKRQIIGSTVAILLCMIALGAFCVAEGFVGYKFEFVGLSHIPMALFVIVTFFYVVGISRNSLLIMQQILSSYSLQLHLRTLSVSVTWIFIFAITKLLPQLLYLVGVGYFYCYMAVFTTISLIFLCKIMPASLNLEVDKATPPNVMETSLVTSSVSSETPSSNPVTTCSSYNEVHQLENV